MALEREPSIQLSSLKADKSNSFEAGDLNAFDGIRTKRLIAYAIDIVCIFCISVVATLIATIMGIVSLGLLSPLLAVGLALIPLAYHTLTIGSDWNATVGMRVMGIEVYLYSGDKPDYLTAFIHSGLFYVSLALTSSLILLVSLLNPKGRLVHDYLTSSGVRLALPVTKGP